MELTPKTPCSATDSTSMALLQVINSMGMIPDSHLDVTNYVGKTKGKTNLSQPSNQAESVSIPLAPHESSNPVIESIKVASHKGIKDYDLKTK